MSSSTLQIQTPRAFLPFLRPARYKGAYGGRGSGKTHFFGELLVEHILAGHVRAVCAREVLNSIDESSKQLIEDKIAQHGVGHLFRITEREITGPHDSLIIFRGLQKHTTNSIKSLEGFNRLWTDEAQSVSQRSLNLVTPTFRAADAEMWFSWNPEKEKDPVDKLFRDNEGDPDFICRKVNYFDNPWFSGTSLQKDMERDRARDPDKYAHVWLGEYQRNSEARVFRNWAVEEFTTPADARFYFGADWGFSIDPTVLIRCWIKDRTLYVDGEVYKVGCEIDRTPDLFAKSPEGLKDWNPQAWQITADSARPETIDYMQRHGFPRIVPALKGPSSVMDGIEFLKSYDIKVHPRCRHVIDELALYSFKTDKLTGEVLPVLEDKKNHTIDALRYALESLRRAISSSVTPLRL